MNSRAITLPPANRKAFAALHAVCRDLHFERHDIGDRLDQRGFYDLPLDKEFPFHIALFRLKSGDFTPTWNWHERLELTMCLDKPTRMRMGDESVEIAPGDLLVVDNLKLHNFEDFPGFNSRVIAMTFMTEFVHAPGSPACDYSFLLPFFTRQEGHPHILRASDELAAPVFQWMAELLQRYYSAGSGAHRQAGCKASFLQILYSLVCRFQTAEVLHSEFVQRRQQAERLARLFEYVRINYMNRISVDEAAKLVHMSPAQFMKIFRKVSGMTFVAYITRVRLAQSLRLLRETNRTIAEIAASTGFPDQSYFDRRFKQAFHKSPRQFRLEQRGESVASSG